MKKKPYITHSGIYFFLMLAMAASLPLSKALMSIVPGLLMVNWLVEGQFAAKFQLLKQRKSLLLILSVFFVYMLGLLWTNNLKWGIHDVKIQLPLLVLPLVIGTSVHLNYRQLKFVIYTFSAAVIAASLCSIWVLLGFSGKTIHDPREMSLFISHIRFALLINICIFSMGWYLLNQERKNMTEKIFLASTIIWLIVFLIILKSVTGWVVFLVVVSVIVLMRLIEIRQLVWKVIFLASLGFIFLTPVVYIGYVARQFYDVETLPADRTNWRTRLGNPYQQDFGNKELENGHYTFSFLCQEELRECWNKKSRINYDSISPSGYNKYVLFRYMTSKGLRKDADGFAKLNETDIRNIENGMTNYRFADNHSFYNRIYQIIWEIDAYRKGGNPAGHSVTQRFEYYKMAFLIIKENFWFGTGTGGYQMAYQEKYDQNKFFKEEKFRQRSHNMFLSYWIDFGIVGLVYICYALFAPVFIERKTKSFLLMVFLLIVLLSFLNEDSLNNHDAISFFVFLYPLYLYGKTGYENTSGSNSE